MHLEQTQCRVALPPAQPFKKLIVVRGSVRERIVDATAIPLRGVHKSVEVFLVIDRLEEHPFGTNRLGVFDQNSGGAIDAPILHPVPRNPPLG